MSKKTDKRAARATTILSRPVHAASHQQTGSFALNGSGIATSVSVMLKNRKRKNAAPGQIVLRSSFGLCLTDDALVMVAATQRGKLNTPVLETFPNGTWSAAVDGGKIKRTLTVTLADGQVLKSWTLATLTDKGNRAVLDTIVAAGSAAPTPAAAGVAALPPPAGAPVVPAAPAVEEPEVVTPEHLDAEAFETLLTELGFEEYADAVFELAIPAARLVPAEGSTKERGTSRFGGWPDLPSLDVWPLAADDEPLAFVLQVDLAQITDLGVEAGLPSTGLLSVFQDARGGLPTVVHTEAGVPLKRLRAAGIKDGVVAESLPEGGSYPASALQPVLTMSLPATLGEDIGVEDDDVVGLLDHVEGAAPLHRIGGYPRELAGPVGVQAAAEASPARATARTRRKAEDFTFVLQLDHDAEAGLVHDGDGIAYVMQDVRGPMQAVVQSA